MEQLHSTTRNTQQEKSNPASSGAAANGQKDLSTLDLIQPLILWDRVDPSFLDHIKPFVYWDENT